MVSHSLLFSLSSAHSLPSFLSLNIFIYSIDPYSSSSSSPSSSSSYSCIYIYIFGRSVCASECPFVGREVHRHTTHMYMYLEARIWLQVLYVLSYSLTEHKAMWFKDFYLAGLLCMSPVLTTWTLWLQVVHHTWSAYMWMPGIWMPVFIFAQQTLYPVSYILSL